MSSELTVQKQFGGLLDPVTWAMLREQCSVIVKSGVLPTTIKTPEAAIAIGLKGAEMGLPLMAAFAGISIVNGKPVVEGQLILAQIYRLVPGAKVEFLERTAKICRLRAMRPGGEWQEFQWTIEDAKAADLLGKDNWKKYPKAMLQWRTVADMGRAMFPDAIMGCYLQDELEPIDVTPKKDTGKSVQDLLSEPKKEVPKLESVDPEKIKIMLGLFDKIGIGEDRIKYELALTSLTELTAHDMDNLRVWYDKERKELAKTDASL